LIPRRHPILKSKDADSLQFGAENIERTDWLKLAYPKKMDIAVPVNLLSGPSASATPETPSAAVQNTVAEVMEESGRQDAEIWMGIGI
jgi:hypothetical protein